MLVATTCLLHVLAKLNVIALQKRSDIRKVHAKRKSCEDNLINCSNSEKSFAE